MALYGGITLPGAPDLENIRRLDLLPMSAIGEMMRFGMSLDREWMWALSSTLSTAMDQLKIDICGHIPPEKLDEFIAKSNMDSDEDYLPMNVDSNKQLAELLFNVLGIGKDLILKRTKSGDQISTGKRQLEQLKTKVTGDHKILLRLVLKYREYAKLKNTYTDKLPAMARLHPRGNDCPICESRHEHETWRIHTQILSTRTSTGRYASKAPNLQNQPIRSDYGKESRKGFVATPGYEMFSVDFSQVQLRFLAHLSKDERMIWVFKNKKDPHTMTAMGCFDLTDEKKVDKLKHRAPAKNVNFALCIKEGQRVLTDRGLVPIQDLLCSDLLWDGTEWVQHEGTIFKGTRAVITYQGLAATPDHKVWLEDGREVDLATALAEGATLAVTGCGDTPLQYTVGTHVDGDPSVYGRAGCVGLLPNVPRKEAGSCLQYPEGHKPELLVSADILLRRQGTSISRSIHRYQTKVQQSALRIVSRLRRAWDQMSFYFYGRVSGLRAHGLTACGLSESRYRKDQQQRELRDRQYPAGDTLPEFAQYQTHTVRHVQGQEDCCHGLVLQIEAGLSELPSDERTDGTSGLSWGELERDPEARTKEAKVYDILNAGPRRRFTCEDKLVSNCFGETPRGLFDQLVSDSYGKSDLEVPDWLTLEWCEGFMAKWHALYPGVLPYMETQYYRARRYGVVWDMFGRTRRVPEMRSVHKRVVAAGLRQAGNHPVQAPDAGVMKLVLAEAHDTVIKPARAEGIDCRLLMTVHDEMIGEVEIGYGEIIETQCEEVMRRVLVDKETGIEMCRVPIEADGHTMLRWEK